MRFSNEPLKPDELAQFDQFLARFAGMDPDQILLLRAEGVPDRTVRAGDLRAWTEAFLDQAEYLIVRVLLAGGINITRGDYQHDR